MEKKINIKLFEDFKNDLVTANTDIKLILEFVKNNWNKFKYEPGKGYRFQNCVMLASAPGFPDNDSFTVEIEIHIELEGSNKIVNLIAHVYQSGGGLISHETSTNPAEYDDVEFEITDIDNVHYSLFYDDPEQQVNDIDIDVDNSGENYKMYEDFIEYVLEGILY